MMVGDWDPTTTCMQYQLDIDYGRASFSVRYDFRDIERVVTDGVGELVSRQIVA